MSDCLLRISEVVAVNVGDIKGSTLHLKASKTDQEGRGEALYICESTRRVIKRYLRKAEIERGALFRRVRFRQHLGKGRLSTKGAREAIKRWAAEAGVEGFISGHSLRVGSAVSLAQAGRRWWICKQRVGGLIRRCRRIMRERNWRNGGRWHGPNTEIGSMPIAKRAENAVQGKYESRFSANSPKTLFSVVFSRLRARGKICSVLARTAAA